KTRGANMALESKILIVIDPTADAHPAVDRVVNLIELGTSGYKPEVVLLFAVDHSSTDSSADNPDIYRDDTFLQAVIQRLDAVGITPQVRISWSREWADSNLYTAEVTSASTIFVSRPGGGASLDTAIEFWDLIRNTSISVGIIQQSAKPR